MYSVCVIFSGQREEIIRNNVVQEATPLRTVSRSNLSLPISYFLLLDLSLLKYFSQAGLVKTSLEENFDLLMKKICWHTSCNNIFPMDTPFYNLVRLSEDLIRSISALKLQIPFSFIHTMSSPGKVLQKSIFCSNVVDIRSVKKKNNRIDKK